ncbi:MAG: pyridoxamine 5'-phosphate oxidase [Halioglobus sp.]|nr:pyridoxamine 5'-phosphate oxidase [Halioglobus sp.]
MAERFTQLEDRHIEFIRQQHLFFVGTAGAEGLVNVSPKGMDSLRVLDARTVAWLNLTGSGNESAAHVLENGRMTLMFCSFDKQPLILRLYGSATVVHPRDARWEELATLFPRYTGARQVFLLQLDMVQTSCGYAVPYYELQGERPTLTRWADKHGPEGVRQYWADNNTHSLDGRDTGIFEDA